MADPMIRNVLNNFQEDPQQAQKDMQDPSVAAKLNKLVAAGVPHEIQVYDGVGHAFWKDMGQVKRREQPQTAAWLQSDS